jgi:hypothetical protein
MGRDPEFLFPEPRKIIMSGIGNDNVVVEYPAVQSHDTYTDVFGVEHCKACEAVIGQVNDFGDRPSDFVVHYCNPADVYRTCMSYRNKLDKICDAALDDGGAFAREVRKMCGLHGGDQDPSQREEV